MLRNLTPRLYQETIFSKTTAKNTLVVLPTGLGKTALAMMLAKHRLEIYPESKILMIAPTKPLVEQHCNTFKKHFENDESEFTIFTGETSPVKREELWKNSKIIFSTPQGLENDIISDKINLSDVSLIVFDEAHRAVGDYAYSFIAQQYHKKSKYPRILGLTASPGSEMEKISEVCRNLFIENVETRVESDSDVKEYVHKIKIDWIKVDLPLSFMFIKKTIEQCYFSKLDEMKKLGYLNSTLIRKTDLLNLQAELHGKINSGERSMELMKSISLLAEATKIHHALELLETQGINALYIYLQKLSEESNKGLSKAAKNLVADESFRIVLEMTKKLHESNIEHPKLGELRKIVESNKNTKMIVFSHYRDTAVRIKKELDSMNIKSQIFVGQAKKGDTGLSQKQQKAVLDDFRNGIFDVLIATSVAEEGLDVPNVDLVLFYEPLPSAIRTIQRRGRTGRFNDGKVIILMANKTRDEAYHWSTQHKENAMHRMLKTIKKDVALSENNFGLNKYLNSNDKIKTEQTEEIKIMCDDREKQNGIMKQLIELGIKIDLKRLDVGDYQLSDRCIVELKTVSDFVDSIIDGRLLEQLKYLVKYERPILIIEGIEDLYSQRNLHPNAIRGMLSTIAVSYGIPIIQTKNNKETAEMLRIIAKREQDPERKQHALHQKKPITDKELQEYIISSLPNVGPSMAKELLHNFRSIRKMMTSNEEELKKIPGVGDKTSKEIQRILDRDYYI
ncbi:DEAD/DEAH box helicase family protein [Candidatus Woesearchaeota archaeon]|nr:DEAD/DEAH box helicase family protein [Candidatus Woesearchaeota archaeon]